VSAAAPIIPAVFEVAGKDGPAILLIHGFGADRLSWLANQQALAAAGRVFALDLPGHGETPLTGPGRLDDLARAVEKAIDSSGIGPVHIIAHSLGGATAIALAAARPDLVRSLGLIAGAGLGKAVDESFLSDYPKSSSPEEMEALLRRLVTRPRLINRQMAERALDQLEAPRVREELTAIADELRRIDQVIEPSLQTVARSTLPRIAVWGAADAIIPLDLDRLGRFDAESLILEDAAHLPHIESPRRVNERLLRWLTAQKPVRSSA
jgi:pyruvate dehydrogenase E2 component (dihydrolipoamide acetyltransferase)